MSRTSCRWSRAIAHAAAILLGLVVPASAEDPPSSGFKIPGIPLPSGLFPGAAPKSKADQTASDGATARPADPAKAEAEKAQADRAMQESTAKVVEMLFAKVQGQVKVGSAALNWSDPIVVKQLEIFDPDGRQVMTVEEIRLTKSLSQMMLNPLAPGGTKLIRPQFFVSIGEENTNVQRVLGAWFLAEVAGKDPRDAHLEIVDGHVHVVKESTGEQFLFTPLDLSVGPHPDDPTDRKITLSWEAPLQGGAFRMEARYDRQTDVLEFAKFKGSYQPLDLGVDLAGRVSEMSGKQRLDLKGFWSYDLDLVAALGRTKGWDVDLVGRKTQPLRVAVDIHDLASSLLAREVKANPAGGTVEPADAPPVVLPDENPPSANPPGPQLQDPNQPRPADDGEEIPVLPTSYRKPPIRSSVLTTPSESAENLEATPPNAGDAAERTESVERRRHWSKAVTVETTLEWDAARWAEVHVGAASVPLRVRDGWALALPTEVPFNDGTLNLAGGLFFGGRRLELAVPAGRLLEDVRLTPELCDYVLSWVAPFVARATNIEGFMTVELDRCLVLLDAPNNSDVRGRVHVDGVRMDVSELVRGLAFRLLGGDVPVSIQMRLLNESTTEFHFSEGRVFHEGMGFVLGDKTLYTNGSIGLDHALDLLVDLTLPFNWLPNGPIGRRLKGTRVQIPVTGTLEEPRVGKITLPNGLGDGFNDGPLSRLLRGDPNELPPGQPPYSVQRPPVDDRATFAPPAQDPRVPLDPRGQDPRGFDPRGQDPRGLDPRGLPPGADAPPPLPPRPIGQGGLRDRLRGIIRGR